MELDASENERKQLAYSTQFFDFTPDAFTDSISGQSLDIINQNLDAIKERLASEFVGKINEADLEQAFVLIKDSYASNSSSVNDVFEKLGRYLKKNIFKIPKDMVLPEDRPHLKPECKGYNGQKLQEDLKSIENMRQEVANVKYRKAVLQEKLNNLEIVCERQQKLLKQAEQFGAEKNEINTMIDQQMNKLRDKLKSIRPVFDQIDQNASNGDLKRSLDMDEAKTAKKLRLSKENCEV